MSLCDGPLGPGRAWCVNGERVNKGSQVDGLLMNSRMIQGVFDDYNSSTVGKWAYPDSGVWDPDRNTEEFIGNLSSMVGCGLNAVTVGMQGGGPVGGKFPHDQPWVSTAWLADGTMDPAWKRRAVKVALATDEAGLVLVFQGFYQGQSRRLGHEDSVVERALTEMIAIVRENNLTNVLLEVANEDNLDFNQPLLHPENMSRAIDFVHKHAPGLLVSTSFTARYTPPASVIASTDFSLYHCNALDPAETTAKVKTIMSQPGFEARPRPVVFNECSTNLAVMHAALEAGAGWGFYDQGNSTYRFGYQSPPVDWRVDATGTKAGFFSSVATLTGHVSTCSAS